MKEFAEIFKNASFTRLFIANVTSQMGSVIGLTAFMFYILDRFSEQPAYATITELMFSLPTLAVFFLVGVVADRLDRQKIAYYCEMIAAAMSLCVLGAVLIGWMPLIFMMLFLRSAVQKFFFPAEQGILQGVLKKEDYTTAAGLNQLVNSVFMLFGNAIGIFVYWTVGIYGAILVDVATLTISGLLIKSMKLDEGVRKPNGSYSIKELNIRFIWSDFMIGLKYILTNKLLLALIYGFIAFGVVNGGFSVMQVFILKYKLAPDNYEQVSIYFGIVFGAGVMIGSFLSSLLTQKVKLYKLIILGAFYIAVMTILASYSTNILVFLTICFFLALGLPMINIAIGGWMPTIIEPKMMGRVQGWITPLMMLSQSITLGIISIGYPNWFSIEIIYWFVGACFLVVGGYYSLVLPKLAKEKEQKDELARQKEVQLNY
ncbi:MFS transporter [Cytobacillus oceanisediminis]|uniref:MFS transporter n=2 Tax=Niallia TaxID=2837506 RepID=A0A941GGY0_NIACI|nr:MULTISPECIES: MFS transporter [Bacillaceae]MBQ6446368.1 MFS transporter [Bacillus sp. (in: firmicutes)]MDU1845479.1 MFS transporter [Niallia nealsonii]MBZ9536345.1 MFS transporter [Cytobacillus oceanisediminis]MCB5236595.1 MFS transporter [Niallia circulans]NMO76639.1 MFS transporter [Niallia alba]